MSAFKSTPGLSQFEVIQKNIAKFFWFNLWPLNCVYRVSFEIFPVAISEIFSKKLNNWKHDFSSTMSRLYIVSAYLRPSKIYIGRCII